MSGTRRYNNYLLVTTIAPWYVYTKLDFNLCVCSESSLYPALQHFVQKMRMRSTVINFWRETLRCCQCGKVQAGGKADEMIASARPKSKGIEQAQKGKGERSTKPTKGDGGKKKSTKKATGSPQAQSAGNGGGVRGQSQSCHQCRQSIHSSKGVSEVKSGRERLKCSQCTRYW